jgi:hypothetical protein
MWLWVLAVGVMLCPFGAWAQDSSGSTTPATTTTPASGDSSAQPADGEVSSDDAAAAEEAEKAKNAKKLAEAQASGLPTNVERAWQLSASSTLGVGSGSFASDDNARRTRVRWGLDFGGSYTIPVIDVTASISTGFTQWLSRGAGPGDQQEPQLFRWNDTTVSFFRPIYGFDFGLRIMGSLTFTIPTSRSSNQSDLYTTINPTLIILQKFGALGFIGFIDYSQNFNKYTSTTYDPNDVNILSRAGGAERLDSSTIAAPGVLTQSTLFYAAGVNYSFLDKFLFAVRFGGIDFWSYDNGTITNADEFTSQYADSARGHGQLSFAALRLTYNPTANMSAGISLTTQQPWKTRDNKSIRFPFFDFESPSNNFSFMNFTVSGFY